MVANGSITRPCPQWGTMTCAQLLEKWASSTPEAVFAHSWDGQTRTYAQAQAEMAALSHALTSFGFRPGDCVLIRAGRRIEGVLAMLAATKADLDVCVVPEGMSARQASEGAVSFAPKVAIEAGPMSLNEGDEQRMMELAANLFTIRIVGCFGPPADGFIDLSSLPAPPLSDAPDESATEIDFARHGKVHHLQVNQDGKVERRTRTQAQLLSQSLASAMLAGLAPTSSLGTAFDPLGPAGLLTAALPVLLVGAQLQQFDALDPHMVSRQHAWSDSDAQRRLVLPAELAGDAAVCAPTAGKRIWVSHGQTLHLLPTDDALMVNCEGSAFLPARQNADTQTCIQPGAITVTPKQGAAIVFGTVQLDGAPQENATASPLMSGNLSLTSPLAASLNGETRETQPTTQFARLVDGESNRPVYAITERGPDTIRVGGQLVSLLAINRALGLTGRWQDAGAFSVPDGLVHNRIEVAVEPRINDDSDAPMPTLEMVRAMLRDSGISDAALPCAIHLVKRVPRRGAGQVDRDALADQAWPSEEGATQDDQMIGTALAQAVA